MTIGVLFLALMPATVDASANGFAATGSVATLLAPAHGTAFAFGQPGHLLTSKDAVGQLSSVRLVTPGGATETATVVATSDASIVQLRGSLVLPALRGGVEPRPRSSVQVLSGPLNGPLKSSGKITSPGGQTNIPSASAFDGAPVLDDHGHAIGVATIAGSGIAVAATAHLHAAAVRKPTATHSDKPDLIPVLAIVFAFGLGVGVARIGVRTRVGRRLQDESGGHTRTQHPIPAARTSAVSRPRDRSEADTAVHIVLRPVEIDEPLPDVRIRPRSSAPSRLSGSNDD